VYLIACKDSDMGRLDDKVALITGATSGIGLKTAELFVSEGASVVIAGRRKEEGEAIEKRLGPKAVFIKTDVLHEEEIVKLIENSVDRFGRIDALFCNAGSGGVLQKISEIDVSEFERSVNILLKNVFFCYKHATKQMRLNGGGSIVANASVAATLGGFSSHFYSALKAAVVSLSRSVAIEVAEDNIRVNTISPGGIATGIFGKSRGMTDLDADLVATRVEKVFTNRQPIPRAGKPEDIANAVLFLCSDEGSFITAQDLIVDGGATSGRWGETLIKANADIARAISGNSN
jgi:NAD(P)-dependent dehydrogenase (short-subunit alcohol dehydrogenase family)